MTSGPPPAAGTGAALDMAAFVCALPVVAARSLAAADGRRRVAGGAAGRAVVAPGRRLPQGPSMVAAGKGAPGAKADANGRKPFVNDGYYSVPTERIRNLSIIAHIDHGTFGGVAGWEGCWRGGWRGG